ncbi:hypothetical protein [Streptomyces sp. NRRL WC-3618]|uniref:hypothetical protein n=1 Tax=Streptomyces sp. NRRL WC-3618 TaxID=1519490 RepID=UPI00131CC29E|nr:hypothetical protein [Streptomyces sp. NRRL WC-3618]
MNDSPGRPRVLRAEADAVVEADTVETAAAGAPRTFLPNARRIHTHQHHTHRRVPRTQPRTPAEDDTVEAAAPAARTLLPNARHTHHTHRPTPLTA